jgi:hypothetical protein
MPAKTTKKLATVATTPAHPADAALQQLALMVVAGLIVSLLAKKLT